MRSASCGNVPAERRASSGPIGNPWQISTPGRGSPVPAGTVTWLARVCRPERNVLFIDSAGSLRTRLAVDPARTRGGQGVSPVACLRQRVGAERDADAEIDELVDDGGILPLVDVVHE